ncbi:MAG: hypothetical protein CMP06_05905 [Xanthomonadales bacterium]|nr:hypothetical protein [Xanthomonadales bacterium]
MRDAEIIAAVAELVAKRPNRGFWKCHKMMRRRGHEWNHKRVYRVYIAMRLNHRRRAKRRLPKRERVALYIPRMPDSVWSVDFMSDALYNGRKFRTFNVVDEFNREALQRLRTEHGLPQVIRGDNRLPALSAETEPKEPLAGAA